MTIAELPANLCINKNDTKNAIINNIPIEEKLNVIMVISNPCNYKKRYKLANDFKHRMTLDEYVELYIVEMCYDNQKFMITEKNNKNHLQLKTDVPLWHKENMINLGITLLPTNWKAFAWIDADIEFENDSWAIDTLKILNGFKDIVQLFSHCADLNYNEQQMNIFSSAGYLHQTNCVHNGTGINLWHPGFAWACTRRAYEKMNGLYDKAILGSGDNIMMMSLLNKGESAIKSYDNIGYIKSVRQFQNNIKNLRFGYVPGVIKHYFHGTKKNRKYTERWKILIKHDFDPYKHMTYDENNVIVPTKDCPTGLLNDIMTYFKERNEDDYM